MIRKKQINTILKDNYKVWKALKRGKIVINIYTLEISLYNKYFYTKTQNKLLSILNRKKSVKYLICRVKKSNGPSKITQNILSIIANLK